MGVESALTPGDELITAYRCHGFTHTRGVPVKEIMAELAGKKCMCTYMAHLANVIGLVYMFSIYM